MDESLLTPQPENGLSLLDITSPEWISDHYSVLARYRELDPVHPIPLNSKLSGRTLVEWHLTRYDDIAFVLKDKRFVREVSSALGTEAPTYIADNWRQLQESQSNWMLLKDPPDHTRLRGLVSQAFTPRVVEGLRQRVQEIADSLAKALSEDQGTEAIDVIPAYAFALPVIVIAELLGVPVSDRKRFREWSNLIARTLDNCTEEEMIDANGAVGEIREYLRGIVAKREQEPQQDLISGLIQARDEQGQLSELELIDTCILLLVAGHETTVNLIANGLFLLGSYPDSLKTLQASPDVFQSAVDEVLRYEGSVQVTSRIATEDVKIGGRMVRRGDWVTVWLAAANRDPSHFSNPNQFEIMRQPNRYVTFGGGVHFCLGAPLARLEGEVALRTFVQRYPHFRLADMRPDWRQAVTFRSLKTLPVHLYG